jgi:hypothetical protein
MSSLALIALLLLSLQVPLAAAAECDGGSVTALRLAPGRVRFAGTVTRRGASHENLAAGGLTLTIVDAATGAVVYEAAIPGERFVTRGEKTQYDGAGAFRGRVTLRNARRQRDTVQLFVKAAHATLAGSGTPSLRAFMTASGRCARTCVSPCKARGEGVSCKGSDLYVPFTDEGFGGWFGSPKAARNPFCGLAIDAAAACDFLIEERCILPYPSSYFLAPDPSTPTGSRLNYGPQALPRNTDGKHVEPTDWNTLDGFSPGPMIMALFPDTGLPVDLEDSGVAFHTDFARSLDGDHPTVLMKAATGERILHFAEMDANTDDVTKKALIMRPGRRLEDGTRYLVAIRNLVDTQGTSIRARLAFRALRDGASEADLARACGAPCAAAIAARRPVFDDLLAILDAQGVDTGDLVLAWDFTTASTQALTGWIVSVRDQAFALGTPAFTVTSVDDGGGAGRNANIFARIQGTFQAPLFMTADRPAVRLNLVNGVPTQNGFATVPFVVDVPRIAWNGSGMAIPARPTLWGHGLVGDRFQLGSLSLLANTYGFVIAAVDMQGMSNPDVVPAIVPLTRDFSKFSFIPERLHQGFLNHLLLGRLLVDPVAGFNSHPAFQFGTPSTGIIDTTEVYYSGGSQGGIFGVAIMSIAEDFKRGFVAVPAANYSTLLHRSIDFNPYLAIIRDSYPDRLDEQLLVALTQQQWDRAEPQGYMNHVLAGDLSDPPVPHKLLIHMATYDSEVSNLGTEIMVRSLGVAQLRPVHRSFFQIPEMDAPFDASVFVEVDPQRGFSRCNEPGEANPGAMCTTDADCPGVGDPPSRTRCDSGIPPLSNTPPTFNNGAHGSTGSPPMGQQIDAFLRPDGEVLQFCSGTCDPS